MSRFPTDEDLSDPSLLDREIKIDGERPDATGQDLERSSDVHRLNHRITLFSILIPCVLCGVLLFAYFDIRQRLAQIQTSGSSEVLALSGDLADKIVSLSEQYNTIEKSLADRLAGSMANKKALEKAIAKHSGKVKSTFSVLRKDMDHLEKAAEEQRIQFDKVASSFDTLRDDLLKQKKEMAGANKAIDAMQDKGRELESVVKDVSEGKVEKKELQSLLKKERASYQQTMAVLKKQMASLRDEVSRFKKRVEAVGKTNTAGDKDTSSLAPGQIIEQEITE